ncbi:MAG: M24 family metallopeptidase [Firmicutes bacterium]|nr:M24 family metallopeptidase [Bacillota bacterium]
MQTLARRTMAYAASIVKPGMPLKELCARCDEFMLANGADSFWSWGIGTFAFSGEQTAKSVSGRGYEIPDAVIRENDIITLDLSPQKDHIWGDFARTLIIEDGIVTDDGTAETGHEAIQNDEWYDGLQTEDLLHESMLQFVTPDTTFEELAAYINSLILQLGYLNLDFKGNLGHSIEKDSAARIYVEPGNSRKLSEVTAFTFEPHIALPGSPYGFKKENIYSFASGELVEL